MREDAGHRAVGMVMLDTWLGRRELQTQWKGLAREAEVCVALGADRSICVNGRLW